MKNKFLFVFIFMAVCTSFAQTIQLSSVSPDVFCSSGKDTMKFSVNYSNIPQNSNIVFYHSTNPAFNPYAGQGDSIGFINIGNNTSGGGQVTTACPEILGIFIDACDQGGVLREVDNEYIVMTSGNAGFNVSSLRLQLPNNSINIPANNSCTFLTPSATTMTTLRNGTCDATTLIAAGQSDFIPANAIVIIFTGRGTVYNYNFSSYCSSGQPIYILQNSCSPGTANFVNNAPGSCPGQFRTTSITVGACSDRLTYAPCTLPPFNAGNPNADDGNYVIHLPNTDTSSIPNGGIRNNAADRCNGLRFDSIAGTSIIKYPIPYDGGVNPATNFCNTGYHYIKAITHPNGSQPTSNTIQFKLVCIDLTTTTSTNTICSGQNAIINNSSADPNATLSWTVTGGAGITGAVAGTGNSINQVLTYNGNTKDSVTYIITAADGICTKTTSVKVVVNKCNNCVYDFTAPDTVCIGQTIQINNLSNCGTTFNWSICDTNVSNTIPPVINLGNISNHLSVSTYSEIVEDNGNYYVFVSNHNTDPIGGLVRYDFGNSLFNTPSSTFLGNISGALNSSYGKQGLQIVKQNGNWYGLLVGGFPPDGVGSTPRLCMIDFGVNIANNSPTAVNWGNIGNMLQPLELSLFNENGIYHAFTVNAENNTITRFDFNNGINNIPNAVNLGNIGSLDYPTGIHIIKDQNSYKMYITNGYKSQNPIQNSSLSRLDFGSSLLNTPTGTNFGNPSNTLKGPRDIIFVTNCSGLVAYTVNTDGSITKLTFNSHNSPPSSGVNITNVGLQFGHSFSKTFVKDDAIYSYITDASSNSIKRMKFNSCQGASIDLGTQFNPSSFHIDSIGNSTILMNVDIGLPTQTTVCKSIIVLDTIKKPDAHINQISCATDSIRLTVENIDVFASYLWTGPNGFTSNQPNVSIKFIGATQSGQYIVTSIGKCGSKKDTVSFNVVSVTPFNLGNDTSYCGSFSRVLSTGNAATVWTNNIGNPTVTASQITVTQPGTYTATITSACGNATDAITISQSPGIAFDFGAPSTTVCTGGNITLDASTAYDSYLWNTGAITHDILITLPGKYWVDVFKNGCKGSDTILVTEISKETKPNLGPDISLCSPFSQPLSTGKANTTWYLNNGQINIGASINATQFGTYIAKVSNSCGDVSDTIVITQTNSQPPINLGNDTSFCGSFSYVLSTGNPATVWTNNVGVPSVTASQITVTQAGTYTATITGGCGNASDAITINQSAGITFDFGSPTTTVCAGGNITLDASTAYDSYLWNTGAVTHDILITQPGKYWVDVFKNGCKGSDTIQAIEINQPVKPVLGADTSFCGQFSKVLSNGSVPADWLRNGTFIITSTSITATQTGTYVAKVSNSCGSIADTIVISGANAFNVNLGRDTTICEGKTLTINATTPGINISYIWNTGEQTPTITVNQFGQYIVDVSNGNCTVSDTILVDVLDLPVIASLGNDTFFCGNFSFPLFTGDAGTIWSTGATGPLIDITQGGTYIAENKNVCGSAKDTIVIRQFTLPAVNLGRDTTVCDSIVLNVGNGNFISILWNTGDTTKSIVAASSAVFSVKVTNANCTNADSVRINKECFYEVYLPTAFSPNGDNINDVLVPLSPVEGMQVLEFAVFNRWGEKVFESKDFVPGDVSNGWKGTYKGENCQVDHYVYYFTVKMPDDKVKTYKGTFALLR